MTHDDRDAIAGCLTPLLLIALALFLAWLGIDPDPDVPSRTPCPIAECAPDDMDHERGFPGGGI